ncbi:hypothetical protein SUGI_0850490 [Cryptomeria japonica]|nr:hypothetical protein SUGI_0850490 [Cryptomeria japonica]
MALPKSSTPTNAGSSPLKIDMVDLVRSDVDALKSHIVIGRILGRHFSQDMIRNWVFDNWGSVGLDIFFLPLQFFISDFDSLDLCDMILEQKVWKIESQFIYVQAWSPLFDPLVVDPYNGPVWINLYNLPIKIWSEMVLETIGKSINRTIFIDIWA